MKYKYLLWDLDGTVLDFLAAEKAALRALFVKYGFGEISDEMIHHYSEINVRYWQALERNEMSKPEILVARFREFFSEIGVDVTKAEAFNDDYQLALGDTVAFCDCSDEVLRDEKGKYLLIAITNGTKIAQDKKLKVSGLDQMFDRIYISEAIGVEKPNRGFFDYVMADLGWHEDDLKRALIIGDSLTSDIRGGNMMGIDTCWYNPHHKVNESTVQPTYEIHNIQEIQGVLEF